MENEQDIFIHFIFDGTIQQLITLWHYIENAVNRSNYEMGCNSGISNVMAMMLLIIAVFGWDDIVSAQHPKQEIDINNK